MSRTRDGLLLATAISKLQVTSDDSSRGGEFSVSNRLGAIF